MQIQSSFNVLKTWYKRGGLTVSILMLILLLIMSAVPGTVMGQTGTIVGQVSDNATSEPLSGARVSLKGQGLSTTSDSEGRYILRRVPAGGYTLEVDYLGYETLEISVSLNSGEPLEQVAALFAIPADGDRIFTISRRRSQSRALNQQMSSSRFISVIPNEQLNRSTDYTVKGALARVPGVQVTSHREMNLRGVGPGQYIAFMDGQRMATTGLGNRNVELGSLSSDLVYDLQVIKVRTPDMSADGLSGIINLKTFQPPSEQRQLNLRLGGQVDPRHFSNTGPGSRFSFRYSEKLREDVGISAFLTHQQENTGWESLGMSFGVTDFGNGNVDVLESVIPELHSDERGRLGGGIQIIFQPSQQAYYFIQTVLNSDTREAIRHREIRSAGGDWADPTMTGTTGIYSYDVLVQDTGIQQYMINAGSKHFFDFFNLDLHAGWSYGRHNHEDLRFPFQRGGLEYSLDMQDRDRPSMQITNMQMQPEQLALQNLDYIVDLHSDNNFSVGFDAELPLDRLSFKVGSSAHLTQKTGSFNSFVRRYQGQMNLGLFDHLGDNGVEVFEHQAYHIPWIVDARNARNMFQRLPGFFLEFNNDAYQRRSRIWNYAARENIYSGYAMSTANLGRFTFIAGARIEYSDNTYEGRFVRFNHLDQLRLPIVDTKETSNQTNILPHVQLQYAAAPASNIRLAYSRTLGRPDFNLMAPFEHLNAARDSTTFRGNPDLEPMVSDNLDLMLEHYSGSIGSLSLGLFYKELSGFIYERQQVITRTSATGVDEVWNERKFANSDESAAIYGVEVSWLKQFDFLPGFLSNFGTHSNYTWSHSSFDSRLREDDLRLPWQSPHVVNASLLYNQGPASVVMSYHWTAAAMSSFAETPILAPSVNSNGEVYMDQYQDGWTDLSASVGYRISESFRFWGDVSNILGTSFYQYADSRDLYPGRIDYRTGRVFRLGLVFDL